MRNSIFVPGNTGFRGFFLVDLTPFVCTRYRVKYKRNPHLYY